MPIWRLLSITLENDDAGIGQAYDEITRRQVGAFWRRIRFFTIDKSKEATVNRKLCTWKHSESTPVAPLRLALALIAGIVLATQATPALADTGYEHYAPPIAKEFPPGYKTCTECQSKLDKLNHWIAELNDFDQDHPAFRDVYDAMNNAKAAEKVLDDLTNKPRPTGADGKKYDKDVEKAKDDLKAAKAKKEAAEEALKKGGPNGTPPPDKSDISQLRAKLDDCLSHIKAWSDGLRDCLPRCKEKTKGE
jgi:hypothetical protein